MTTFLFKLQMKAQDAHRQVMDEEERQAEDKLEAQ